MKKLFLFIFVLVVGVLSACGDGKTNKDLTIGDRTSCNRMYEFLTGVEKGTDSPIALVTEFTVMEASVNDSELKSALKDVNKGIQDGLDTGNTMNATKATKRVAERCKELGWEKPIL